MEARRAVLDEGGMMGNGDVDVRQDGEPAFWMLRTFSTVQRGMMARFMGGLTWQAAWLRHFFGWDRAVVGYALTDIPERVMEIYTIPSWIKDVDSAREVLKKLHAQPEYKQLESYCSGERRKEEAVLPTAPYQTSLQRFFEMRQRERDLVDEVSRNEADLKQLDAKVDSARKEVQRLTWDFNDADRKYKRLEKQVMAGADDLIDELEQAKNDRADSESKLGEGERKRDELEVAQSHARELLRDAEERMHGAQSPAERCKEYLKIGIPAYFLDVTIKVKPRPEAWDEFVEGMRKLIGDFKWKFIAAGRRLPKKTLGGVNPGEQIMNLWGFNDANALYLQMVELRENERFVAVQNVVGDELQMLMCEWEALSGTKGIPHFPDVDVRRSHGVPRQAVEQPT